jgi:hypothetical protein
MDKEKTRFHAKTGLQFGAAFAIGRFPLARYFTVGSPFIPSMMKGIQHSGKQSRRRMINTITPV